MAQSEHFKRFAKIPLQLRTAELDALHVAKLDSAKPLVGQEIKLLYFDDLILHHRPVLFFNSDNDSLYSGGSVRKVELHSLTSDLAEELAHGRIAGQVDGEALQSLVNGITVIVVHCADPAARSVLQDQAFEQIIDVLRVKL